MDQVLPGVRGLALLIRILCPIIAALRLVIAKRARPLARLSRIAIVFRYRWGLGHDVAPAVRPTEAAGIERRAITKGSGRYSR
jgi:hypothetical protein